MERIQASPIETGRILETAEARLRIDKAEVLPFVTNGYSARFRFDSITNPKLQVLREQYRLADVIAPGKGEFDQQVRLMDWVHNRFEKFGHPSTPTRGALDVLNGIAHDETFFCTQFAEVLCSTAASLGWVDRVLALRRHQGNSRGGSTEHSTTEIWSNEYRKWVMLDPTSNMYLEKDGVPLNAFEIRLEWFYREGRDLVFVVGKDRQHYRKKDLPIHLKRFPNFGELTIDPDELDKYGFIGYIPNTDLMDSGFDYGGMFIVKDKLCDGTQWHTRTVPTHPATDPYFPLNQAAIDLEKVLSESNLLLLRLASFTPNFREFQVRFDDGTWQATGPSVPWKVHRGGNRLEVRAVNAFGVSGPVSTIELSPQK